MQWPEEAQATPAQGTPAPIEAPAAPTAESLTAKFRAGAVTFAPGEKVPVRLASGAIGTVSAEDASGIVDSGGELLHPEEFHRAQLESQLGGVGGTLAAGGAGFARGLTVGLSDPVALGIAGIAGGDSARQSLREKLAALQEIHPVASGAGEVAGVLAPALLSGGAGAVGEAARVAGGVNEGIAALGRGAERLAGGAADRILGEVAPTFGSRVLHAAIRQTAKGAAEGAAYGLGAGISEATLGDTNLNGEKLLASIGHGALLGGALGALGGVGGEAVKEGVHRAQPFLRAQAEDAATRALNMRKTFITEANKIPGGTRAMARRLLSDGIIEAGDTVETLAPKLEKAREAAGEKIAEVVDKIPNEGVSVKTVLQRLDAKAKEFEGRLGYEGAAAGVRAQMNNIARIALPPIGAAAETATIPFKQLLDMRRSFEGTVNWKTEKVAAEGIKSVGRTLEDLVTERGDELARKHSLGDWVKEYKDAKLAYRQYAVASDGATDAVNRAQANARHSLTDKMMGAAAGAAGVATHGPAGLLVGAAGAQASKLVRTQGNSYAATALDRLANLKILDSHVAGVDKRIDQGIKGFLGAETKPAMRRASRFEGELNSRNEYEARAAELSHAKAQRERVTAHVADIGERLAAHAPETIARFEDAAHRTTTYLASQLPKASSNGVAAPFAAPARVADQDILTFLRKARATDDPLSLLDDLARGKLSRDAVEAVRETHLALFEDIRAKVMARVLDQEQRGKRPTFAQRQSLGMLFDLPTDWSLMGPNIAALQEAAKAPEKAQGSKPRSAPAKTPSATLLQTDSDRRAAGGQLR